MKIKFDETGFKLLPFKYFQQVETNEFGGMLPVLKRGKGCQPDHDKDEQAILESSLNKLVGAADVYNLEVE